MLLLPNEKPTTTMIMATVIAIEIYATILLFDYVFIMFYDFICLSEILYLLQNYIIIFICGNECAN